MWEHRVDHAERSGGGADTDGKQQHRERAESPSSLTMRGFADLVGSRHLNRVLSGTVAGSERRQLLSFPSWMPACHGWFQSLTVKRADGQNPCALPPPFAPHQC